METLKDSCFTCRNSGYSERDKDVWCRCRQISLSLNASLNMICSDGMFKRLDDYFIEERVNKFNYVFKNNKNRKGKK